MNLRSTVRLLLVQQRNKKTKKQSQLAKTKHTLLKKKTHFRVYGICTCTSI